ncbi:MAG: outer membrane lipoprotein-sorting protein [Thermodesulfobacteriota bacterium]|nr:outer membrane lipoprotein-sorting protein [Thermodesulfobacteriota bacterium]
MVKKTFVIGLLLLLTCPYGFAANKDISEGNQDVTAIDIIDRVSKILALNDIRSEQVMTVCREDGTIRQYRLRIMTSGKDKAFAEIVEPKQFKDRQFLRLGDTVWAYFPDRSSIQSRAERHVKRAIRVSGREIFMGGDFTNNDVLRLNLVGDYTPEIIEDLPDQYVLKLKGKDLKVTYAMLRLWVRKGDFQPIRMECYTISDELIKSVFYQDYRDFGEGLTRPGMLEVKSAILPKSKTFLEIIYLKRGVKNPAHRFQRSSLGK